MDQDRTRSRAQPEQGQAPRESSRLTGAHGPDRSSDPCPDLGADLGRLARLAHGSRFLLAGLQAILLGVSSGMVPESHWRLASAAAVEALFHLPGLLGVSLGE
jgi:hypothetical protein